MRLSEIFSKSYLLDPTPAAESSKNVPLLVFFSLLVLFGIIFKLFPAKVRAINNRYFLVFFWPGLAGLLYLFGRYESLPWLGSRLVLFIILFLILGGIIVNTVWALRFIPQYQKETEQEERFARYLPKPKKS